MLLTTKEISTVFTTFRGDINDDVMIRSVNTDSRNKKKYSLFIPLVGENFDGHDYVEQAINNGAIAIIWDENKEIPSFIPKNFPVFLVHDTTEALQQLAHFYRKKVNPIVIGITGSNGKTTTKDIITSIMETTYKTHSTKGNLNNHIGLPLTILGMSQSTEILVLEMGMNHFNEIDLLSKIANPDYAIITNIGESHIKYLGTREGIAKAKLEIIHGMKENGILVIDGDEELLKSYHDHENVITCGFEKHNDLNIRHTYIASTYTCFELNHDYKYSVPLLGNHHAKNATYGIAVGKELKITDENIQKGLSSIEITSMRFEFLTGKNNVSIINDAYNASPTSMKAAIEVVKQLDGFHEKVLVLGDIFELGGKSKELHESIATVIEPPISHLFTIGKDIVHLSDQVKKTNKSIECHHFSSNIELIDFLEPFLKEGTLLLFKASRSMQFENLIERIK